MSVGPPGAKITFGTAGSRATIGLPGTGLFASQHFSLGDLARALPMSSQRNKWRQAFIEHLERCVKDPNVSVRTMKAALAYRDTLALTDKEMGEELLEFVASVSAQILEAEEAGRTTFYDRR